METCPECGTEVDGSLLYCPECLALLGVRSESVADELTDVDATELAELVSEVWEDEGARTAVVEDDGETYVTALRDGRRELVWVVQGEAGFSDGFRRFGLLCSKYGVERPYIVATRGFTDDAYEAAERYGVETVDADELAPVAEASGEDDDGTDDSKKVVIPGEDEEVKVFDSSEVEVDDEPVGEDAGFEEPFSEDETASEVDEVQGDDADEIEDVVAEVEAEMEEIVDGLEDIRGGDGEEPPTPPHAVDDVHGTEDADGDEGVHEPSHGLPEIDGEETDGEDDARDGVSDTGTEEDEPDSRVEISDRMRVVLAVVGVLAIWDGISFMMYDGCSSGFCLIANLVYGVAYAPLVFGTIAVAVGLLCLRIVYTTHVPRIRLAEQL